jgi:hypothetical protein
MTHAQIHARAAQIAAVIAALSLIPASAAFAQGSGVLGPWTITKAALAPWADAKQAGGPAEAKRLVGQTVTFAAHSVRGPEPLGCSHAVYQTHNDTPDLLFEGSLAEDSNGKMLDAVALARKIGMTTKTVRTIETSCSEVAYHMLAPDTLVFGLNNRIYTMHPKR